MLKMSLNANKPTKTLIRQQINNVKATRLQVGKWFDHVECVCDLNMFVRMNKQNCLSDSISAGKNDESPYCCYYR